METVEDTKSKTQISISDKMDSLPILDQEPKDKQPELSQGQVLLSDSEKLDCPLRMIRTRKTKSL